MIKILLIFLVALIYYKASNMFLPLVLILMIPFRFEIYSFTNIKIRLNDLIAVIFIISTLIKIIRDKKVLSLRIINLIIIFWFWITFSLLINAYKYGHLINLSDYIRISMSITTGLCISYYVNTAKHAQDIIRIWSLSAIITSILTIYLYLNSGNDLKMIFKIFELNVHEFYEIKFNNSMFYEDPNNLASFLITSFFIIQANNHLTKNKFLKISATIITLIGIALTLSRSAYLAVILAPILFKLISSNKVILRSFTYIILLSLVIFFTPLFFSSLIDDISILSRVDLWKTGLNMTRGNFLFGVGIGNSVREFYNYTSGTLLIRNPHFHNLYLTISSEMGVIGLLLFLLIVYELFCKVRMMKIKELDFLYIGLIAYLIQSLGVEYFASRHFWVLLPFVVKYSRVLEIEHSL